MRKPAAWPHTHTRSDWRSVASLGFRLGLGREGKAGEGKENQKGDPMEEAVPASAREAPMGSGRKQV